MLIINGKIKKATENELKQIWLQKIKPYGIKFGQYTTALIENGVIIEDSLEERSGIIFKSTNNLIKFYERS